MKKNISLTVMIFFLAATIDAQNVGIGTPTPIHAKLEVVGAVGSSVAMFGSDKNGVAISANNPEIGFNYFFNGSTYTMKAGYGANMGMYPSSGNIYFGTFNGNQSTSDFGLISGYQQVMTIKQNGNIGIGIDDPISQLHIFSKGTNASQNPGLRLSFNDGTYASSWNIYPYQGNLGPITGALDFAYESTVKSYISSWDGSYNSVSDIRLKKNIRYFNDNSTLDVIRKLKPARYLMKDEPESNKYHIGFISQDVEKIFPEVVNENNGIKMMNYSGLVPIAIEGIKELQTELETIQSEKKLLEERLKKLESIVNLLQSKNL